VTAILSSHQCISKHRGLTGTVKSSTSSLVAVAL